MGRPGRKVRILRRIGWIAGISFLVVAGLVLVLLGLVHTDWGRERILALVVPRIDAALAGALSVDRLEGSLLGRFSLHGIAIGDGRGKPALTVERLEIEYDPWSLLDGAIEIEQLEMTEPRACLVREGESWNLARLLAPPAGAGQGVEAREEDRLRDEEEEPGWTVRVGQALVEGGRLEVRQERGRKNEDNDERGVAHGGDRSRRRTGHGGEDARDGSGMFRLVDIGLRAAGELGTGWARLRIEELSFRPEPGPGSVRLAGRLVRAGDMVLGRGLRVSTGKSHVGFPWVLADIGAEDPPGVALAGAVELLARVRDAGSFRPEMVRPEADVRLQGAAWNDASKGAQGPQIPAGSHGWHLVMDGTLAGGRVLIDARAGDVVRAELRARGLRPGALFEGVPDEARQAARAVETLRARVSLADDVLSGELQLSGPGTAISGNARLRLGPRAAVEQAEAVADVEDLERLGGAALGVSGDLHLDARLGRGRGGLQLAGDLRASRLEAGPVRVRHLESDIDLGLGDGLPAGRVELQAKELTIADRTFEQLRLVLDRASGADRLGVRLALGRTSRPLWLRADATVRRTTDGAGFVVRPLRLGAAGAAWRGHAEGGVTASGRVRVRDLRLDSEAGTVSLRARAGGGEPLVAAMALRDLDLQRVLGALEIDLVRQGRLDAALVVRGRPPALRGAAAVELRQVRLEGFDRSVDMNLAMQKESGSRLAVDAAFRTGDLGTLRLVVEGRHPPRPWRMESWRRLRGENLRIAQLDIEGLRLERVRSELERRGMLAPGHGVAGRLDMEIRWMPDRRGLRIAAALEDLGHGAVGTFGDVWLLADLEPEAGVAQFHARAVEKGELSGRLRLAAGLEALGAGRWKAFESAALRGRVLVEDFDPGLLGRIPDVPELEAGRIRAQANLEGSIGDPAGTALVEADGLRLDAVEIGSVQLRADRDRHGLALDTTLRVATGDTLQATLRAPRDDDRVRVRLQARDFGLAAVEPWLAPVKSVIGGLQGRLETDLSATLENGSLSGLTGTLDVTRARLGLAGLLRLRDLDLHADADGDRLAFELDGLSGQGRLTVKADARVRDMRPERLEATIGIKQFPVPTLQDQVVAGGTIQVKGEPADGLWNFDVDLDETRLRLLDYGGGDLHGTGDLEDVVYAEDLDQEDATAGVDGSKRVAKTHAVSVRLKIVAEDIQVRGRGVKASAQTDLEIELGGEAPVLKGEIEVLQGRVEIFDRTYQVRRGRVTFDASRPPDPQVNVILAHEFPEAAVLIAVSGPLSDPRLELRSDPPGYSRAELLGFVLGGRPGAQDQQGGGLGGAALDIASSLVTSQLQELVRGSLPVDVVRIGTEDPASGQVDNVTVGKWLTDSLFVAYRRNLQAEEDESSNVARLEYWFAPGWLVEGRLGDRGNGGVDLMWTLRF